MIKTQKGSIIKRSSKYGVGKQIGNTIYVHRTVEDIIPESVLENSKELLPLKFFISYEIVKYNSKNGNITFINSPDWNESDEPVVGDSVLIKGGGAVRLIKQKSSPQIYHHKWLFVKDDYSGFDVENSKNRSRKWVAIPDIDYRRIGYKKFWDENVISLI